MELFNIIFSDIAASVSGIITGSDTVSLAMMALIGLVGGLSMNSLGQLIGRAAQSTVLLGLGNLLFNGVTSPDRLSLANWRGELASGWAELLAFNGASLIGYMACFLVILLIVYGVRRFVR